jgi:hypothetical protein
MTKAQHLELLMLLSALESWSFAVGTKMPDYLYDQISNAVLVLTQEVLK